MWNPYSSFPHKSMEVIDEVAPVQNKIIEISLGWFDSQNGIETDSLKAQKI